MANSEAGNNDDFAIHVDSSCLTDSTDLKKPAQRSSSDATVIHNDQFSTDAEKDEHTEALIQAAARDIIEKIEQDAYDRKHGQQPSGLSYTEEHDTGSSHTEGSDLTFGQETELTYEDGTEMSFEGEERIYEAEAQDDGYDGSASSHREDDVFSHGRTPSGGSNNSSDTHNTDEEARYRLTKEIAEEVERQQVANHQAQQEYGHEEDPQEEGFFDQSCDENDTPMVSRVPSCATTTYQSSLSPNAFNGNLDLSSSCSPSSIRALQMSSPAPSVFSGGSPMSRKRPTVSRLGAPQKTSPLRSTKITPKFAAKEDPLVLLHVTVLPLRWPHADIIENAPNDVLSKELLAVKQSWKVLKDKLGDTVLERGVLIPHPQDSYETLDERLCAALELPHRPRAKILDCGHYLGPTALLVDDESDASSCDSSDSEDMDSTFESIRESTWCDVCCKDVRFGKYDKLNKASKKKTFKVKVYASNGLMGSGAWAACWKQMEKVDVEIEPAVEPGFNMEISNLFDMAMAMATRQPEDGSYEEVESPQIVEEPIIVIQEPVTPAPTYQEATRPSTAVTTNQEPAYMEARSFESPPPPPSVRMLSPEPSAQLIVALPVGSKIRHLEDEVRRIEMEEARHREIYGNEQKQASRSESKQQQYHDQQQYQHESRHSRSSSRTSNRSSTRRQPKAHVDEDSFLELLLAAARVLLSDKKNLMIGFLGMLVVVFALNSGSANGGMTAMNGVGDRVQPSYETAFQRQEAAMQRLQMEDVARMRVQAESMAQKPVDANQAQHAAVVEDVQRVQHVVVHDSQPLFVAQRAAPVPVVSIQQAPMAPVAPVQHASIPAPPPAQQITNKVKPAIPAVAPVEMEKAAAAVVEAIEQIKVAGVDVVAKVAKVGEADFAIPTPPASIKEAGIEV